MTAKLDKALIGSDDLEDPRLIDLPRGVRLLHFEAIGWCARHKTDGVVSRGALRRMTDEPNAGLAATQLVSAGMWEATANGWRIVDYLEQQMSAEDVASIMEANRLRQRRFRQHRLGDHSLCDRCPAVRNGVTNGVTNGVNNALRLDSTRAPKRSGEAREAEADAARKAAPPPSAFREEEPTREEASAAVRAIRDALTFDETSKRWVATSDTAEAVEEETVRPPAAQAAPRVDCNDFRSHQTQLYKTDGTWHCRVCEGDDEVAS